MSMTLNVTQCNTVCEFRMVMSQNVTFLSWNKKHTKFHSHSLLYTQIIQDVIFDFYQLSVLRPTFLIMSIKIVHLSISLALYLLKFLVLVEAEVEMNIINTLQNISFLNVIVIKFYNIKTFVLFTLGNTMLKTSKKKQFLW